MKVLVTGGLGYIGSVLVPRLRQRGHACRILDYGLFKDCTIKPSAPDIWSFGDCRQFDEGWLTDTDVVVHLAAFSNDPTDRLRPDKLYPPSLAYSEAIAAACKQRGVRFVFASSCSVYGIGREDFVTEISPVNPQTLYAKNKFEVEQKLQRLGDENFRPIALRFGTIYGFSPRIRFDIVINMFAGMAVADREIVLNSDGKSWRPHLHIDDAALAIQLVIDTPSKSLAPGLNVFNVGHNNDNRSIISVAQLAAASVPNCTVRALGDSASKSDSEFFRDQNVRDGVDVRSYRVNFDKIHGQLGYEPHWRLETGIPDLVRKLTELDFSGDIFRSSRFYRLAWTDQLVKEGQLTEDLTWTREPATA